MDSAMPIADTEMRPEHAETTVASKPRAKEVTGAMLRRLLLWHIALNTWLRDRTRLDEVGASLVEYALLLALIAVVAIGALIFLGHSVSNTLNNVANNINNA
jgi:pilus assembly protein Flp/PilA